MGCCSFIGFEHEVLQEERTFNDENSQNISFADLSIGSKEEYKRTGEVLNTDDLNSTNCYRLRSTSCNSLRYSAHLESAFLMTTPIRGTSIVSKSWNLKSNETFLESSLNFTYLPTYN